MEALAQYFYTTDSVIPWIILYLSWFVATRGKNRFLLILSHVGLYIFSLLVLLPYNTRPMALLCACASNIAAFAGYERYREKLIERFDKAVDRSNEDKALRLGTKLLQMENKSCMYSAIVGFGRLAAKNLPRSREQFGSAVCQYFCWVRRKEGKKGLSAFSIEFILNDLDRVLQNLAAWDQAADPALLRRIKAEQLYWYTASLDDEFLKKEALEQIRAEASKILGEIDGKADDDPEVRACIEFAKTKGILPPPAPKPRTPVDPSKKPAVPAEPPKKPVAPGGPPKKPGIPQTLKTCLRCGAPLSGRNCGACGLDHTGGPVHLLVRVDPRDLQISQ